MEAYTEEKRNTISELVHKLRLAGIDMETGITISLMLNQPGEAEQLMAWMDLNPEATVEDIGDKTLEIHKATADEEERRFLGATEPDVLKKAEEIHRATMEVEQKQEVYSNDDEFGSQESNHQSTHGGPEKSQSGRGDGADHFPDAESTRRGGAADGVDGSESGGDRGGDLRQDGRDSRSVASVETLSGLTNVQLYERLKAVEYAANDPSYSHEKRCAFQKDLAQLRRMFDEQTGGRHALETGSAGRRTDDRCVKITGGLKWTKMRLMKWKAWN